MDNTTIDLNEYNRLIQENNDLKQKNKELEEHLKKYTNSKSHVKYYENNADVVKERAKIYMTKVKEQNPEKLKEWRHTAYLKRKAKLQQENSPSENH
jgi:cell division septum initiation protein DivIVA